jgi:hypothetical protein
MCFILNIAVFWIKQSRASFVECLKLLKAIKVVEKVLKAFSKAMTYYQMTIDICK